MARRKKRAHPYPEPPLIPDELWLPFVVSLTGDKAHDNRAITSLAYILDLDPEAVRFRLAEDMAEQAERFVFPPEPTLH